MEQLIPINELLARVTSYNPRTDVEKLRAAYEYAKDVHKGQKRRSGEAYFTHPVAVAALLAEQRLDDATIITAILHDTVEDTAATYGDITELFGKEIAELVDGVTKLTNLQLTSSETKQAENFRKLFMAMSKDVRVILVKLFDRLHNMRTIKSLPPEKQARKARETMDIYAPLAGRMGMQWMRDELEDLSFQVLNPEARVSIMRRFVKLTGEAGNVIDRIKIDIETELAAEGITGIVIGRAKKPYSIWRKMEQKETSFSRLSDIYGFRVITDTQMACYHVLGVIHRRWRAVPTRFKDYISQPKQNGYRSLHTAVLGRDGKRVEVQIRTDEMHDVAEAGVAAHWAYKDGERAENPFAVDPAAWIAGLAEHFEASADDDEFFEAVKLEMYSDKVFCFTPKGDVVKLPRGATPLDFAFAIHTRIGSACVGAKIDGQRVPLWTQVRNGQSVEIITAEGQSPQATWMDIAVTGKAKSAIRRALRAENRSRFVKLGRELARVAFEQVDKRVSEKALMTAATRMGFGRDAEELLSRLGSGEVPARDVVTTLYPELADHRGEQIDANRAVVGLEADQTWDRGQCCKPVPGERIVGITMPGKGVVVHAIDCPSLTQFEDQNDRWIDLRWHSGPHMPVHPVSFEIVLTNDAGVLGRICTLIGEQKANISDLVFVDRKPDYYRVRMDVELSDTEHLHRVTTALEAESNVAALSRYRDKLQT
ncbi:RelA/SpoT family protein [Meridianimarinicoccus aquatilis]|uniref:GTP pyrophosphokinase rsh n=1 Tax=Meridianimarinicoccus aquatilis TaxID=2552766 RepID=A0A4R6AZK3_9RHOB|nr:bifunctional (p)ppGpp synthetase/guanosine-3',5'-bis(diphosphate) 3'-pyrophosphohydrolase [Fluviibacterium aquatile]QIE40674.1 bifunctional (p)ppGpp synthetase/guanosine-3',5'-bis(diphosphate) 3'-pyrophosphohydrolase [Rhodobacteraceae bacterium SC52]TDL87876.1 bifunctional (p)ppGpp synthetase/guanosine-3',5'-bis(diphosphate) 3'-pyrophosphohydrolase [Fluviibacterium aquatile]